MGQVLPLPQLLTRLQQLREQKSPRVVFTNGCFDILHVGHTRYLRDAKSLGDVLVVGLNSDASVRQLNKGPARPIQHEQDRAEILASLNSVDFVVIFTEPTPKELIQQVAPDVLVKGGDWKPESIVGSESVLSRGGQVKSLPFHPGHSTTSLVNKIERG